VARDQLPSGVFVRRPPQTSKHKFVAFNSLGKRDKVCSFLARHSPSGKPARIFVHDRRGGPAPRQLLSQPPVQRVGRRERHLLLEDDSRERSEAWGTCPQRRRAVSADDPRERTVAASQVQNRGRERAARQQVGFDGESDTDIVRTWGVVMVPLEVVGRWATAGAGRWRGRRHPRRTSDHAFRTGSDPRVRSQCCNPSPPAASA